MANFDCLWYSLTPQHFFEHLKTWTPFPVLTLGFSGGNLFVYFTFGFWRPLCRRNLMRFLLRPQ